MENNMERKLNLTLVKGSGNVWNLQGSLSVDASGHDCWQVLLARLRKSLHWAAFTVYVFVVGMLTHRALAIIFRFYSDR